jgi:hypothetical protein
MLTEMKKAHREAMASAVEALCARRGVQCRRGDPTLCGPKEIALEMCWPDVRLRIDFDGSKGIGENRDVFCMPWCIDFDSDARFSNTFERIMSAPVNRIHEAKCTAFAVGFDELLERLESAFDAIADRSAFKNEAAQAA